MKRRDFLKGCLSLVVLCSGCDVKSNSSRDVEWINKKFEMPVGQDVLVNDQHLYYAGMNQSDSFSMSSLGRASCNFFYPTSVDDFYIYNHHFKLEEVTPEKLTLTYLGRRK